MIDELVKLQKYAIRAPKPWQSFLSILLLSALPSSLNPSICPAVITSALLAGIPFKEMIFRRSLFLSAISTSIFIIFIPLSFILSLEKAIILSLGFVVGFRVVILSGIFPTRFSIPLALFHPLILSLFLSFFIRIPWMTLACIIAVFLFFSLLYFNFLDSPLRKAIGASGRDFIRGYISENQREVEKFFNKFGRIGKIPISIIAIKSESGKGREMKSIWVVPSVHPGPIGSAGSGNLPSKLSEILGENTFVFHGCGGYDFSMVRAEEIEKICDFVGEKLSGMNFSMVATRSIRVGNIVAQRFGGSLLFIFSPPFRCGDLDFSLSLLIPPDSVLIDSHSSGEGKDLILPGKNSYELMRDVERAAALLKKEEEGNVKIGISSRKFRNEDLLGMKIAVVEVLGQRTAYVLLDGNNLVSGLSEYLSIGETIILTTDTHVINVKKVYNPVGSITDGEELRRKIVEGIREATIDLEPVLVGMKKDFIDLEILYPGTTAKILTALTFIRFLAPILAVMTGMVAVIVSSLLLHFF